MPDADKHEWNKKVFPCQMQIYQHNFHYLMCGIAIGLEIPFLLN